MKEIKFHNTQYSAQQCGLDVLVQPTSPIDLHTTFNCGQAFRWRTLNTEKTHFCGVHKGIFLEISTKNGELVLRNTTLANFNEIWRNFFALDDDYKAIKSQISQDKTVKKAVNAYPGIRVLEQDPFETIISFIISANNNILRISKIIESLCENFGEIITHFRGSPVYTFPTAEKLASLTEEDLSIIKAGYRAKYIIETAKMVEQILPDLKSLNSLDNTSLRKTLQTLQGVGPKVADCIMLFAFKRLDICPQDVWVKRILAENFDGALPDCCSGFEGIAQQFLFHYFRNLP